MLTKHIVVDGGLYRKEARGEVHLVPPARTAVESIV
jgi:hypothetical protein